MPKVRVVTNSVTIELDDDTATIDTLGKKAIDLARQASKLDTSRPPGPGVGFRADLRPEQTRGYGTRRHQPRTTA